MSLIIGWTLSNPCGMRNDTTTPHNIAISQQRINLAEVGIGNTLQTGDSASPVNHTGGIALMIGNIPPRPIRGYIPNHLLFFFLVVVFVGELAAHIYSFGKVGFCTAWGSQLVVETFACFICHGEHNVCAFRGFIPI